jgi:outer membrane receptor protein involved in Fe transport
MFRGQEKRGLIVTIVALVLVCGFQTALLAQTGTISGTVRDEEGKPLAYANVIIDGTTLGAMSLADGKFTIPGVPAGTYKIRAMMMGYKTAEKNSVKISGGETTDLNFQLEQTIVAKTQEIVVTADKPMVEVTESKVTAQVTGDQLEEMPVDDVLEAVALKAGIVKQGDEMHVRGGRGGEVQIQIDGVPVDDPLGGSTVGVGILGTSGSEIVSGGMDAEYGDAQSAVINITTKEGGRRFGGEFRYFTDDFGRQDKTYTNFDRVSLGFGGPTWWRSFRYYVSGEATFSDTENSTIEPRTEHKITDWFKFRERQTEAYNLQSKLSYNRQRIKLTAEAIVSRSKRDQYINNWNVSGYVSKVWMFQGLGLLVEPQPGEQEIMEFTRLRGIPHGPWAEIEDPIQREQVLNIRPVTVRDQVRDPVTGQAIPITYDNFRAADIGTGDDVITVVWDEAVYAEDGTTFLYYKPWALFEGYQFPYSQFQPFLRDPAGADTSFVAFNSATRTPEIISNNLQFKLGFNHNITSKLLYSLKVSRLQLKTKSAVTDAFGNQIGPGDYATAGLQTDLPGTTDDGETIITNAQFYTDDDEPYLVTAYDYPFYANQKTVQYLMRGDITSEQLKGHRIKSGLQLIYNRLEDDERTFPGQTRENQETGLVQQGLNVNRYTNYNAEGALYAQDKWEYEGMVVNGGLRFEWFSTGNNDEIKIYNADIDPSVDRYKWNISPRLGFAFPITDRDKFFFHYGRFTQWPSRVYLFKTQDAIGSAGTLGNPNLEPELTVSYQAGISHQFTDDVAGNFVVFNKDIYGLVSSTLVTDDSTGIQSFRYINKTYASSRGLELSLEKRLTRRLGFEVYYTYSFADGVASDADFGRSAEGLTHLPTEELPLDWDQRHTFNVTLRLQDRNKWGATAIYQYGSGVPWTPFDRYARLQDPENENSRRLEPTHQLSVQGRKQFNVYGRELTLFFEGRNLLDDDVLLPFGVSPGAFPGMLFATMDNGSYLTETGRYGGAYLQDIDDDGLNEFNPVYDPTIWQQHRIWRLGIGFEF